MNAREVIIKETHRGLLYQDGVLAKVLGPGRHEMPRKRMFSFARRPVVEVVLVDVRDQELTIKGQEILTADKVAVRVSILVQYRVVDPAAAAHKVAKYEDRLYSDVQLAARRSLAGMTLEEILTERNRLSEDILREVKDPANRYGVEIARADVKDLAFPGNLQEIMNRVLAAERQSEAQLVEARTKAEVQTLEARTRAESQRLEAEVLSEARRLAASKDAEVRRIQTEAEIAALEQRRKAAASYAEHPALLRLAELETLRDLARSANAKLYIDFAHNPDHKPRASARGEE
jgi:regulator of protease activity HflC (stomatin/prohibitin superfamily)